MSKKLKITIIILFLVLIPAVYFIVRANDKNELKVLVNDYTGHQETNPKEKVKNEHEGHNKVVDPEKNILSVRKETVDLKDINLSPSQQVVANVAVDTVKVKSLSKEINTVGKITYDETKLFHVSSWIAGRIDKIYTNYTGMKINKGDKMLEIYSPDLVSAQQEYIQAYESYKQLRDNSFKEVGDSAESLLYASRRRLLLLGVKEWQINELEKTHNPRTVVPVYSTATGIIVSKNVQEGHYVETGAPLFDIADLSIVWMEASVYEYEMKDIRAGQLIDITTEAYPEETFNGKVTFVNPALEAATKTVKVRASLINYNLKLKPEMVVNAKFTVNLGQQMIVPRTAVLLTGDKPIVWIEQKKGIYNPVEVKVGKPTSEYYPILSGLKKGQNIVVSGGFLLDSESQMNTTNPHAGMNMPGMEKGKKPEKTENMGNMEM